MRKELIIIQKIFPVYRKAIFDRLSKKINLILLHSKNDSGIKQIETNYSEKIFGFRYGKKDTAVILFCFFKILKYRPKMLIHEFAVGILSLPFILLLCKILKIKFILWGHGYDRKRGFDPEKSFFDKLRLFYLKMSDAVLLYGKQDKLLLSNYIPKEKIFVARNTLDTDFLFIIKSKLKKIGKEKLKKVIGFKHRYNLIFIGRLLKSKKPDMLLDLYENIKKKLKNNIGIHFIGDGEYRAVLQKRVHDNKYESNIFFHGAVFDERRIGQFLFCSDLMVMPGELGLSINHAFCFDCPIISFKTGKFGPFHGPEIEYVINNKTGFLIEYDNIDLMTKKIIEYLNNKKMQENMKRNISKLMHEQCTIQNMEDGIIECIEYLKRILI